jgi:hypothetical protein
MCKMWMPKMENQGMEEMLPHHQVDRVQMSQTMSDTMRLALGL